MKKRLSLLTLPFLFGVSAYATTSQDLIDFADKAIQQEKITVDKFISTMQSIHEVQKSELKSSLEKGEISNAQTTLDQRTMMYPLTSHLYDLKAGNGKSITNASGVIYTFKLRAPMDWMNISRGDTEYYVFPKNEIFLELLQNINQTGMLYNETAILQNNEKYLPTYFYAGENTLQDMSRKSEGLRIMELKDKESDLYFFYDLPQGENASISVMSGGTANLSDIYEITSYSPEYFLTSLDEGFQFCQKVSAFIGKDSSSTKEYSAQECSDAATMKFYKEMHPDILKYAANLYL